MSKKCNVWNVGQRVAEPAAKVALVLCLFVGVTTWAESAPVVVLKEMPPTGSVRQGEVVYVDDGRCPAGEVKKITGGNLKTGVVRQVECVKRPRAASEP